MPDAPTPPASVLDLFHPAVAGWFRRAFGEPTAPQREGWPAIAQGKHTLIAAPTGSGKTLAAFLAAIDRLIREGLAGELRPATRVVYVSPLKALSNDIERNLQFPLAGITEELRRRGLEPPTLTTAVRTGDTPSAARQRMVKRPPHLFVTTPESLYILLTSEGGRRMLSEVEVVIVDEIHAVVGDKRGSHLALTIERLRALVAEKGKELQRIGLSATQRPIEAVAEFLVGADAEAEGRGCEVIDRGFLRTLDLAIELPPTPLEAVIANTQWDEVYARLAALVEEHRTTLIFVNTRRLAERLARHLGERLGKDAVTAHHGSLSKDQRHDAEQRLKAGRLRALVATASLELGIDIGAVELVCQIGSPRSISGFLQRVGRSGHRVGEIPKGRLFPTTRDDLVECAALLRAVGRGELDRLIIPEAPLDILAQQIVAMAAVEELDEEELFARVRRTAPFAALERGRFDAILTMLGDGFSTRRGRRGALIHRDQVHGRIRGRRGASMTAIQNGGAIPDTADYDVIREPEGLRVGSVHEDFAVESMAGDIFQLGATAWRVLKVEPGRVRVEDAAGQPPTVPFWLGEAPGRSVELSAAVASLRGDVGAQITAADRGAATSWLMDQVGIEEAAAEQIVDYLGAAQDALGAMPTQETIVIERFFDEAGGMQLVIHAPFGARINRAWGLALRKRFCRSFNFELQAAATDDAIVISLGAVHSFPVADVFDFLRGPGVRDVLIQALLDAPMFTVRWRWNTSRALAVPRRRGGKKVAPQLQRMIAEDLAAVVFPDQGACLENIAGDREIPDHPLVQQTIDDCLTEAMDVDGFLALIDAITSGRKQLKAVELSEPSPLAHEVLTARPYAFLDDAPLEERRTQAVILRRSLDPEDAKALGALDGKVIAEVRAQVWPRAENADELHDAMCWLGYLTVEEGEEGRTRDGRPWRALFDELTASERAAVLRTRAGAKLWIAAERLPLLRAALGEHGVLLAPAIVAPPALERDWEPEPALVELVRGRLEGLGPITAARLAGELGLEAWALDAALVALESEGFALRGRFSPGVDGEEWCERGLLARIHRGTLHRLRQEIAPVTTADFIAFLLEWQGIDVDPRPRGAEALARALGQLVGWEAPAAAWEGEVLPARIAGYDPAWLDSLCLSGQIVWSRLGAPAATGKGRSSGPVKTTPIALMGREDTATWAAIAPPGASVDELSADARALYDLLRRKGALFFGELVSGARLLRAQAEAALGELVARGLVTSDGFAGLRALTVPSKGRGGGRSSRRRGPRPGFSPMDRAGRWSLIADPEATDDGASVDFEAVERCARALLRRYGVIFRGLMARERSMPRWRDLLRVLRRLEARGELRGGYFVSGAATGGEHFALPEAVGLLRSRRRRGPSGRLVTVAATDPLNLVGVLTPGERLPAVLGNRLTYRDGVPIAALEGGHVRHISEPEAADATAIHEALMSGGRRASGRR
ncbi:MAG: DEAD/DEAH box helicase [Myxococcales bacterium]|nr:DEAD/DEAH box helicase [Myxococcales bacterium]